jgi:hypothetical protein
MDWLYTIVVVLLFVWVAGLLLKIGGKFIHIIIVIALAIFIAHLLGFNL